MLELRCPSHPGYLGDHVPGTHGLEERVNKGAGGCGDCWEKFRQVQEKSGNPEARR